MKEKLSTRESLTVYAMMLGFTLAVFLFGLHIGMTYVGRGSNVADAVPDDTSRSARSTPKVDFFEQVNKPRPTRQNPQMQGAATTGKVGDPKTEPLKQQPDVMVASGSAPAQPAPGMRNPADKPGGSAGTDRLGSSKPSPPATSTAAKTPVRTPPLIRDEPGATLGFPLGAFTIQIGAVGSEKEARELMLRLENRGYTGILDRPANGERFYRVRVGAYPDRASAARAERLLKDEGFPTYVKKIQTGGSAR